AGMPIGKAPAGAGLTGGTAGAPCTAAATAASLLAAAPVIKTAPTSTTAAVCRPTPQESDSAFPLTAEQCAAPPRRDGPCPDGSAGALADGGKSAQALFML